MYRDRLIFNMGIPYLKKTVFILSRGQDGKATLMTHYLSLLYILKHNCVGSWSCRVCIFNHTCTKSWFSKEATWNDMKLKNIYIYALSCIYIYTCISPFPDTIDWNPGTIAMLVWGEPNFVEHGCTAQTMLIRCHRQTRYWVCSFDKDRSLPYWFVSWKLIYHTQNWAWMPPKNDIVCYWILPFFVSKFVILMINCYQSQHSTFSHAVTNYWWTTP